MKTRAHTIGSTRVRKKRVPQIRLSGQWLERQGFRPGRKFIIREMPGSLTLNLIVTEEV